MAWDHLSINRPHLAYAILGGFTSLFMLVSLFVKEKLYIGEATVATICGIIFGPHAANLFNPNEWGNVDQITLEISRIVLVVQCFAVGVELPKAYMTRHWKSVVFLLVPVMTWGWLITSLFIWAFIRPLNFLDSMVCAACVTATDPVLASSVVGKGKFARRVPKHLRDLLSAESGCNDGMAFPFIYLALYLVRYRPDATKVFEHWFILTILYECIFGAVYGCCIGYAGRRMIRWASDKGMVDRESFLVFYFVLALFCAGTGSMLGVDDLLVGFCAGVAFSNDGWFAQKTEESHVSNVIDLLLNLAYFVYFGAIIPWDQYNNIELGMQPWRLVVISLLCILFRRIPIMLMLKPFIPDIHNRREALFAGHFGPIGVGAIFVAILARAELEHEDTTPLAELPGKDKEHYELITLIWPVVTFLVVSSIIVHGSSIAVFTLGKRINRMTLTMSYTQGNEDSWVNRLPFISRGQSLSIQKPDDYYSSSEKIPGDGTFPPGTLPPPGGVAGGMASPRHSSSRARKQNPAGGFVSSTAIQPRRRDGLGRPRRSGDDARRDDQLSSPEPALLRPSQIELPTDTANIYQEGDDVIVENEDGDVIDKYHEHGPNAFERTYDPEDEDTREEADQELGPRRRHKGKRTHGTATAYQIDNNVIVEDEDGEVIKIIRTNTNPARRPSLAPGGVRRGSLQRLGSWFTGNNWAGNPEMSDVKETDDATDAMSTISDDAHGVHLHEPNTHRRMSRAEILNHLRNALPEDGGGGGGGGGGGSSGNSRLTKSKSTPDRDPRKAKVVEVPYQASGDNSSGSEQTKTIPYVDNTQDQRGGGESSKAAAERAERARNREANEAEHFGDETPAERKRRLAALGLSKEGDDDDDDDSSSSDEEDSSQQPKRTGIRFAI